MLNNTVVSDYVSVSTKQIVFIDSQVENIQTLVDGVLSGIETVVLNANRDGIEQITEVLDRKTYTTVHIVSHGSPGCIYLGNTQLNLDTLNKYQSELKTWFSSSFLSPCSSLLIYGCNVAAGDAGEEFIAKLNQITGAQITASTTRTGNAALGGNWNLGYQTNSDIAFNLAFTADTQRNYIGILEEDEPLAPDLAPDLSADLAEDLATVTTDKQDYPPGSTATITGENFEPGETIELQVLHNDGTPNTGGGHDPWQVTDGSAGDLDGKVDGNFRTTWYVNPDDSLNSSFDLTATGLNSGRLANHTFTDSDPAVQFFYIPFDEDNIETAFNVLEDNTFVSNGLDSITSITVSTDNSIVYYDHWEDGYETNLNNPTQSSTEVWGDNDPSNGIAPGFTTDVLNSGDIIALDNDITTPRDSNTIFYDGRDKVGASKAVIATRQLWFNTPGPVLAGASEILDTSKWGTNFIAPIGEDTTSDSMFEYTSLFVTATENGTNIEITGVDTDNDGSYDDTINETLDEGETYFVNGGVGAGATVDSGTKPIQANLVTGDIAANWESRFYTLFPVGDWSNTYYSPVGTVDTNNPIDVFLYNPNGTSIDVSSSEATENPTDNSSATSFSIPAGEVVRRRLQNSSAVSFSTGDNGLDFFAVGAIDADAGNNANHDWGFSLIPDINLTPSIQIGWGLGSSDLTQNGSPLWVTTTKATTIYVDYDGDGVAPNTDINGGQYDEAFPLGELESKRIFDTKNNDNDQSGIKVYTVDGTDVSAAWGQDPATAGISNPFLDLGTTVLPLPISSSWKTSTLIGDDGDGLGDLGETIKYGINVQNDGVVVLGNINVSDIIPEGTTYVPGSTTVTYIDGKVNQLNDSGITSTTNLIADDTTGTAFPLDDDNTDNGFDSGLNIVNIDAGESAIVNFQVSINNPYDGASGFITNAAKVDSDEESFTVAVRTELDPTVVPTQTKTLYLSDDSTGGGSSTDLDRNDPVATNDSTTSESSVLTYSSLVGLDFDPTTNGSASPTNWSATGYDDTTLTDLIEEENGNSSVFDLSLDFLGTGGNTNSFPSNIPSHTNNLANISNLAFDRTGLTATWSGLEPSTDYNIYVFGLFSFGYNQDVTITGSGTPTTFNQSGSGGQLSVNGSTGSTASSLDSYSALVTSDISGNIEIDVDGNNVYSGYSNYIGVAGLAIEPVITGSTTNTSFNQSISLTDALVLKSDNQVSVTAYIDVSSGAIDLTNPEKNDIATTLTYDSGTIATVSNPTSVTSVSGSIYEVVWQATLDNNVTIPSGEDVNLEIENSEVGLGFKVLYDSETYPSKIDLPTTTVINVDSIEFYNDSSTNGGNQINAATQGDTVYVRVQVSDPFGDSDITGLNLVVDDPNTPGITNVNLNDANLVDTSVDAAGNGIKIYEYALPIDNAADLGEYTVTATATEGLETTPVTDTASTNFTVNNGSVPDVFISDAIATEGNKLVFDVTLTDTNNTNNDIVLGLATEAGTATEVGDYENANFEYSTDGGNTWIIAGGSNGTQVTIPTGSSGIKVRIDSVNDTTDETNENFILKVDRVVSGNVGSTGDTGTGTIVDDDAPPNVSIDDVSLVEGNSSTKDFTFAVTLDKASNQTVTVDYYTSNGTATAGTNEDYTAIGTEGSPETYETITFAPGETSKTIKVSVNGETAIEPDETFNVVLDSATNANITDSQGLGTIINDDSIPDVVVGDASEVEGNQLVFDVGLTSPSSEAITLTLNTTGEPTGNNTATDGTDYENTDFEYSTDNGVTWQAATNDQVIIPAGETNIKVRIESTVDGTSEGNETFTLGVTAATGATSGAAAANDISDTGTGTIIDDDGTPEISINDVTKTEGDSGTTSFTFTVSLDTASSSAVTVDYDIDDGTATIADSDYTDGSGTLTFAAGETSKTITVDVTGDTPVEPDETFTVDLSNPTNATIADNQGLGTILNDDDNTGTISGTVFADTDNDDAGESPLSGVTIELLDSNGNSIDSDTSTSGLQPTTTTTNTIGGYTFDNVDPGNYLVKQTNLPGYIDVSDGDSTDGSDDTPANASDPDNLIPVTLTSQEIDTGNDFVDERTGTIKGEVLADTNNDDIGDSPLADITIELFEEGNATAVATTITNSNGEYSFDNIAPGNYTVVETNKSDYGDVKDNDTNVNGDANGAGGNTNKNQIAITLSPGATSVGNDFVDERGFISGTAKDSNDNALESVTITLKNNSGDIIATTATNASGEYSFADLPSGTYTVEETNLAGYTNVSDVDSVNDGSNDTETDNGTVNDSILEVTLVAGEADTGNDFVDAAPPETIAGKVLEDTNGDGIGDTPLAGVEITLSGTANLTTTTASDGSYSFDVSATGAGTYTLSSPAISGYAYVNESDRINDGANDDDTDTTNNDQSLAVALAASEIDTGNNFVYVAQPGTISGTVFANDGSGNVGKNDVILSLLDGNGSPILDSGGNAITDTTSGGGAYSFDNLKPGNYRVVETDPTGYSSVSDEDSTTDNTQDDAANTNTNDNTLAITLLAGETDSGNNFYDQLNGTISGSVFADDGDRTLNVNTDTGLGGVTVTLRDSSGNTVATATTSSNGTYSFADVVPGDYTVEQSDRTGYTSVLDTDSDADAVSDDATNTADNDNSLAVTLLAGETDSGNNFLDEENGSISGSVKADTDGDSGTNTSPLSGVTVTLRNSSDNSTVATTTTDGNGNYNFSNVAPGNYTVEETNPDGYTDVSENEGGDDNDNADNGVTNSIAVTVTAGESDTGNDFVDEQTGSISGTVSEDSVGGTGIAGVTITLTNTDTSATVTTTTASDGTYSFADLAPGNYQIDQTDLNTYNSVSDEDSVDNDGGASGTGNTDDDTNSNGNDNQLIVALSAGESDTGNNFVDEIDSSIGTVSGQVLEDTNGDGVGDTPIPGATVELLDSNGNAIDPSLLGLQSTIRTTGSDGTYSFLGIPTGSYQLKETNVAGDADISDIDGDNDNIISVEITVTNTSSTGNNFVDGKEASISGVIWEDFDTNGLEGNFEDRVDGTADSLTVTLTGGGPDGLLSTTGDNTSVSANIGSDGSYSFTGLNPGEEYQVQFPTSATGYTGLTTQDQGSNEAIDSDANTTTGIATFNNTTDPITLDPDEDLTDIDAGLIPDDVVDVEGTSVSESLSSPGSNLDEIFAGYKGQDTLTGGGGEDTFFFNETSDGVDVITDFNDAGSDKIDLRQILATEVPAANSTNVLSAGYVLFTQYSTVGTMVQIDFDGSAGELLPKSVVLLQGDDVGTLDTTNIADNSDFLFF